MKLFMRAILLFSPFVINAQNHAVQFDTVVSVSGTKSELFSKTKIWITKNFNSPKDAVQTEDKEEGIIIAKGQLAYQYTLYTGKKKEVKVFSANWDNTLKFNFGIYLKDRKVKLVFSDIVIAAMPEIGVYEYNLDSAKYIESEKLSKSFNSEEKARGMSGLSELKNIEKQIKELMKSIIDYLAAKSATEF